MLNWKLFAEQLCYPLEHKPHIRPKNFNSSLAVYHFIKRHFYLKDLTWNLLQQCRAFLSVFFLLFELLLPFVACVYDIFNVTLEFKVLPKFGTNPIEEFKYNLYCASELCEFYSNVVEIKNHGFLVFVLSTWVHFQHFNFLMRICQTESIDPNRLPWYLRKTETIWVKRRDLFSHRAQPSSDRS